MNTFSRFHTLTRDGEEIEVEAVIQVLSWGHPGGYWSPPEGMETDLLSVRRLTDDGASGPDITLTQEESEKIETEFHENPPEDDYGPED